MTLTPGVVLPEGVAARWAAIADRDGEIGPRTGAEQTMPILKQLRQAE